MNPLLPVIDFDRKLLILRKDGKPASHPCGNCVPWSIYAVCWREGGCGTAACTTDVYLDRPPPGACGLTKFVFAGTVLDKLIWGPVAAQVTGTVEIEFTIDQASVDKQTINTTEGIDTGAEFNFTELEESLTETSGWHSLKAYAVWKDGAGTVVDRETYAACLCVGICPTGDEAPALHDVMLLPGTEASVCINPTLQANKILGDYRSYFDANFVRSYWASIIDTWAEKCVCPNTCVGAEKMGGWNDDGPFAEGNTDITGATVAYGNQDWLDCLPMDIPLYVDLNYICTVEPQDGISIYLKFYDADDNEVGEIEIGYEYDGQFIVPPCQYVKVIVSNDTGDVWPPKFSGLTLPFNFASNYANAPLPDPPWTVDTESECPYGEDISDMVPSNAEYLREWLPDHVDEVNEWWEGQQEE